MHRFATLSALLIVSLLAGPARAAVDYHDYPSTPTRVFGGAGFSGFAATDDVLVTLAGDLLQTWSLPLTDFSAPLGSMDLSSYYDWGAKKILRHGTEIYLAVNQYSTDPSADPYGRLRWVDLSDPALPTLGAHEFSLYISAPISRGPDLLGIRYEWYLDGSEGSTWVRVSIPWAIRSLHQDAGYAFDIPGDLPTDRVAGEEYVFGSDFDGLTVYGPPSYGQVLAAYPLPWNARLIDVLGDSLFVQLPENRLAVWDVTDPWSAQPMAEVEVDGYADAAEPWIHGLVLHTLNGLHFVRRESGEFRPLDPWRVGGRDVAIVHLGPDLVGYDPWLGFYAVPEETGLWTPPRQARLDVRPRALDLSGPEMLSLEEGLLVCRQRDQNGLLPPTTRTYLPHTPWGLAREGDLVAVLYGDPGVEIFQMVEGQPSALFHFQPDFAAPSGAIVRRHLVQVTRDDGLTLYDLEAEGAANGHLDPAEVGGLRALEVDDALLWLLNEQDEVLIVDAAIPSEVRIADRIPVPPGSTLFTVDEGRMLIGPPEGPLRVYGRSASGELQRQPDLGLDHPPLRILLRGSSLYVLHAGHLECHDFLDDRIQLAGWQECPPSPLAVHADQETLVLYGQWLGVYPAHRHVSTGVGEEEPEPEPVSTAWIAPRIHPNPSRGPLSISFSLDYPARVRVGVYDVRGRRVVGLHEGRLPPGPQRIHWDGRDTTGRSVANGVYFLRLEREGRTLSRRLTILR